MRTISIINLKGGVAKTISSCNIAHILATVHNKKVLLIDNDKQGNASILFGKHSYEHKTIADIMTARNINVEEVIQQTDYEGLDIIPANMNLLEANKKVLIDSSRPQQIRLSKALEPVKEKYDFCIIDNAPDINMSVTNAFVMSNDVLVPIKVDRFAFDGLQIIIDQIEDIKEFNPDIKFGGCFITMYQKNSVNTQGFDWLKVQPEYPIFNTVIRKTVKVDETTFEGKPLLDYAKNCTASKDYISLVSEYLEKIQLNK